MTGKALDRKRLYYVGNLSIFMIGLVGMILDLLLSGFSRLVQYKE